MIDPRSIETAPRDGTPIFAYDGVWWRDRVRWKEASDFGPAGWYFQGLRINATQWYPRDSDYEELQAVVAIGYRPIPPNGAVNPGW